jgi:hypothetical protein
VIAFVQVRRTIICTWYTDAPQEGRIVPQDYLLHLPSHSKISLSVCRDNASAVAGLQLCRLDGTSPRCLSRAKQCSTQILAAIATGTFESSADKTCQWFIARKSSCRSSCQYLDFSSVHVLTAQCLLFVLAASHILPPDRQFLKRARMRQSADQGLVLVSPFRSLTLQLHAADCTQLVTKILSLLFSHRCLVRQVSSSCTAAAVE